MSTATLPPRGRIYWLELKVELLRLLRAPGFLVPTILSPLVFYVIFGLTFARRFAFGGVTVPTYMLATYGVFGVIGVSLFAFGLSVARERAAGWFTLKRVSPMPPEAFFIAKLGLALFFNMILILCFLLLGLAIGGVVVSAGQFLRLALVLLVGTIPFATLGFALGFTLGSGSGPALANLAHLPLSFCSGLWIPLDQLPGAFQSTAPLLPHYHFAQLALGQLKASYGGNMLVHVAVLAGYSLVSFGVALLAYRREMGAES